MRRVFRVAFWLVAVVALLIAVAALTIWWAMRASLPSLDGEIRLASLSSPVWLTRDADGTVAITAETAQDAVRALGYVHAQERFFEMDLARRSAAGELSKLLGAATLSMDMDKRRHRMRARTEAHYANATPEERAWFIAYADGVNRGLNAFPVRPWQYLLLRTEPDAWRETDSLLVISEMYFMLQGSGFNNRYSEIQLRKMLGDKLFDWLQPLGGDWDAALDGSVVGAKTMPTAEEFDVRKFPPPVAMPMNASLSVDNNSNRAEHDQYPGSNNWAIGGTRTTHGGAMLANDMHLGLGVPGIWFRAQLAIGKGENMRRIAGVTLPGVPQIVAGSNGDVAWGFTNSYGQWFDWVALAKVSPDGKEATPAAALTTHRETIDVKGGESVALEIREAAFGPVLFEDATHLYALSWALYREGAVINAAKPIMFASTIDDAAQLAALTPSPHQNIMIADKTGNIVWTILGRIPVRESPQATRGTLSPLATLPTGWLAPDRYPLVKNPPVGQLWTANNRQLSGAGGGDIGDGGFDLGARAGQIRDRLRERATMTEKDLYAIQLDSESRFLKRWAALAQSVAQTVAQPAPQSLPQSVPQANDKTAAIDSELKNWNGRADIDQTGHRIARAFRERVQKQLWLAWLNAGDINAGDKIPAAVADLETRYSTQRFDGRFEYPVWQALTARPMHLLPPPYSSWDEFLVAQLIWVHDELVRENGSLKAANWGKRNTARIRHPFSRAMPFLASVLDMPAAPQPGDNHMPRVSAPGFGASQRLVVSPGREEQGILTVAGGQSGHPLSPFYGAGHRDWLEGKPTPLLAGETQHTLQLRP